MKAIFLAGAIILCGVTASDAAIIRNACLQSDRARGNEALCRCVQAAADRTLNRAEQRRAARFFRNPDEAQKVRMSKVGRDTEFWARYRAFGEQAEAICAR